MDMCPMIYVPSVPRVRRHSFPLRTLGSEGTQAELPVTYPRFRGYAGISARYVPSVPRVRRQIPSLRTLGSEGTQEARLPSVIAASCQWAQCKDHCSFAARGLLPWTRRLR